MNYYLKKIYNYDIEDNEDNDNTFNTMIIKSYSGIINAIDKNAISKKVYFSITVDVGLFTFLLDWRQLSSYVLDNVN